MRLHFEVQMELLIKLTEYQTLNKNGSVYRHSVQIM